MFYSVEIFVPTYSVGTAVLSALANRKGAVSFLLESFTDQISLPLKCTGCRHILCLAGATRRELDRLMPHPWTAHRPQSVLSGTWRGCETDHLGHGGWAG